MLPLLVRRVQQKEAHCGPATLEMLFSFYDDLCISQDEIVEAAGISETIVRDYGARVDQLGLAVKKLFPDYDYVLLAKYHSTLPDLVHLTGEFGLPVGVEWQGLFSKPDGGLRNQGHYSVITAVDLERGMIKIVDPENKNTLTTAGEISLDEFEQRWWEVDNVPLPDDPTTTRRLRTDRLVFVVIPQQQVKPFLMLGFEPASLWLMWRSRNGAMNDSDTNS